mgnify:CR=1 FL=1
MGEETQTDRDLRAARERIRLLEFQIDHLRRELNFARVRHEGIIYSVAWALATPVRAVEQWLRRALAGRATRPRAAAAVGAAPAPAPADRPRLLVDVTRIVARDDRTGVQRVVRRTLETLYAEPDLPYAPAPVRVENGALVACNEFATRLTGAPPRPDAGVAPARGDVLLIIDNAWTVDFTPAIEAVRAAGGSVATVLYDLIPILHAGSAYADVPDEFARWLARTLMQSDAIVAISQTVADELVALVRARDLPARPGLRIGHAHIGADFAPRAAGDVSPQIAAAFAPGAPVFLAVGALEPRKGHRVALAAFDDLWRTGFDARLAILGRKGWHVDALIDDMRNHPEFGRRLFWFDDASDADLAMAYARCTAVLAPSYAEGYGLPLSEAAAVGKPVICSDIPVFREIGRDGALYFRVNDPQALAATVRGFAAGTLTADPARILQPTWRAFARALVDLLRDGAGNARPA